MRDLAGIGRDWLCGVVGEMADHIDFYDPLSFIEKHRYLPQGTTPRPGYMRYDGLFPFLKEILLCFDTRSPVREVNLTKGAQVGFTTGLLESVILYLIAYVKTQPGMFLTADGELASGRMENSILPTIHESGFSDLIRSADVGNTRKTGKTKDHLQWDGGGFLIFKGAKNAAKMRMWSVPWMVKDELDGWDRDIGRDGNSDKLTDDRLAAYWPIRKILRGSTPTEEPSLIWDAFQRGDKRYYMVLCKRCSFPQYLTLRTRGVNEETGKLKGFHWETQDNRLVLESVRYCCLNCGHEHFERDKEALFDDVNGGAHWKPTATPVEAGIRSYHLQSFYSPYGFRPWSNCVSTFLSGYDPENKRTLDVTKFQVYWNNVEGLPFRVKGGRVKFMQVSAHRRPEYRLGEIPNAFAAEWAGSEVLMLLCVVDVHKSNLAVQVFGFTSGARCFLIDYWRFDAENDRDDCREISSPVWQRLHDLIDHKEYEADNGTRYRLALTLIDANGDANSTVLAFCGRYESGVLPIIGRQRPARAQDMHEFASFSTPSGTVGYKITVDHYKDRNSTVLNREWTQVDAQPYYHFNAPVDTPDAALKELTVEYRREKIDPRGNIGYEWHRPGNAPNELWDGLGYAHAGVEIIAYELCIQQFGLEQIDWEQFWEFAKNASSEEIERVFCRLA